jgi:cytochrome c553
MKLLRISLAILASVAAVLSAPTLAADGAAAGRTPKPVITIENPGKCIAPADEMRRNHMEMLKHQRDRTMREGVRGEPASLNECVSCHASKKTGTVHGEGEFCQSCHAYAAVKLDCFQCHQPKAGTSMKSAHAIPGAKP